MASLDDLLNIYIAQIGRLKECAAGKMPGRHHGDNKLALHFAIAYVEGREQQLRAYLADLATALQYNGSFDASSNNGVISLTRALYGSDVDAPAHVFLHVMSVTELETTINGGCLVMLDELCYSLTGALNVVPALSDTSPALKGVSSLRDKCPSFAAHIVFTGCELLSEDPTASILEQASTYEVKSECFKVASEHTFPFSAVHPVFNVGQLVSHELTENVADVVVKRDATLHAIGILRPLAALVEESTALQKIATDKIFQTGRDIEVGNGASMVQNDLPPCLLDALPAEVETVLRHTIEKKYGATSITKFVEAELAKLGAFCTNQGIAGRMLRTNALLTTKAGLQEEGFVMLELSRLLSQ